MHDDVRLSVAADEERRNVSAYVTSLSYAVFLQFHFRFAFSSRLSNALRWVQKCQIWNQVSQLAAGMANVGKSFTGFTFFRVPLFRLLERTEK